MNTLYKLIIIVFTLFLISCENPFNPSSNNNKPTTTYEPNTTPEQLLKNLSNAYQQKDIKLYEYCLAEDFKFQLIASEVNDIGIDLDNDGIPDSEWFFQQEIEYHKNLFQDGSSDGQYPPPDQINLRFTGLQIEDDTEEGHEGWLILATYFNLDLIFDQGTNMSALGYARYFIKPIDGEWKIAIWRDESNVY